MTNAEKEEIIAIIKDTLRNEMESKLDKEKMKKDLVALYKKLECIRPYTCSYLECINRKVCILS